MSNRQEFIVNDRVSQPSHLNSYRRRLALRRSKRLSRLISVLKESRAFDAHPDERRELVSVFGKLNEQIEGLMKGCQ